MSFNVLYYYRQIFQKGKALTLNMYDVSDEIMSNLSLAQDYPSVFTIQGTFSCLLYIFAKFLSLSSVHIFQN